MRRYLSWRVTQLYHYDLGPTFVSESTNGLPRVNEGVQLSDISSVDQYLTPQSAVDSPYPENPLPWTSNPVLRGTDVDDYGRENFVADPFLWPGTDGLWHMFFEVYSPSVPVGGSIGHATSPNGREWEYDQIVLRADTHLSFPYVFKHAGDVYMIPEEETAATAQFVNLYRATEFPREWIHERTMLSLDHPNNDTIVFRWDGRWWMLVGDSRIHGIHAYYADDLFGGWSAHENNPVIQNRQRAGRPGGRPIVSDDGIIVFYQDCEERYGHKLRTFGVSSLSPSTYVDYELEASPVLTPTGDDVGWNAGRMHHIDPWWTGDCWICAVDGNVSRAASIQPWSIGMYVSE